MTGPALGEKTFTRLAGEARQCLLIGEHRTLTEIQFIGPSSSVPKAVIADNNLGQALPKCGRGVCPVGGGAGVQKPNHRHARLLRVVGAYN